MSRNYERAELQDARETRGLAPAEVWEFVELNGPTGWGELDFFSGAPEEWHRYPCIDDMAERFGVPAGL